MASYREIGARLGAYIRANNPSTLQIQGLLADLLTGDELLLPMRDLVSRPCFFNLQPFAGSGGGMVQRDAYIQELARSYLPIIVDHISQVINGMLDQPVQMTRQATEDNKSNYAAGTKKPTQESIVSSVTNRKNDLLDTKLGQRSRSIPPIRTYPELVNQRPRTEAGSIFNQSQEPNAGTLTIANVILLICGILFPMSIALTALETNCAVWKQRLIPFLGNAISCNSYPRRYLP